MKITDAFEQVASRMYSLFRLRHQIVYPHHYCELIINRHELFSYCLKCTEVIRFNEFASNSTDTASPLIAFFEIPDAVILFEDALCLKARSTSTILY